MTAGPRFIGGNPPLADEWFAPAADETTVDGRTIAWLASGRDGYLLAARTSGRSTWLVPDPICPVVIDVLRAAGCTVQAYLPGHLAEVVNPAVAVALVWDVAAGPDVADVAAAASSALILEDRCLWAGLPADLAADSRPHWIVGSARKWLGTAEGGWLIAPPAQSLAPVRNPPDARHAALQLAAAAVRSARGSSDHPQLEAASLALVPLAEDAVGTPLIPRAMSVLGRSLLNQSNARIRSDRQATASALVRSLTARASEAWIPALGANGVRLALPIAERDACRAAFHAAGILAPIHWPNGAWSGAAGAQRASAQTLTLPVAVDAAQRDAYVASVATVLARFPHARVVERLSCDD